MYMAFERGVAIPLPYLPPLYYWAYSTAYHLISFQVVVSGYRTFLFSVVARCSYF
jgi:hypothetical protein